MREIDEIYVHKFRSPELYVVDEQELEEDRAYLRAMYPMRAKMILVMVEDACGAPVVYFFVIARK